MMNKLQKRKIIKEIHDELLKDIAQGKYDGLKDYDIKIKKKIKGELD